MARERISNGLAITGQILLTLIFAPIIFAILYITFSHSSLGNIVFSLFSFAVIYLILSNGYSYADIYLEDELINIRKLFVNEKIPVSSIKKIGKGLAPFSYYLKLVDNKEVYFLLSLTDWPSEFFSLEPDKILKELKIKVNESKK